MLSITSSGSTSKTMSFLQSMRSSNLYGNLDSFGQRGVAALQAATPVESGLTAMSWSYEIEVTDRYARISWVNSNRVDGVNVAIILQYGHGTGTGGYVTGQDYINTALKPIFDEIANDVWKRVTSA